MHDVSYLKILFILFTCENEEGKPLCFVLYISEGVLIFYLLQRKRTHVASPCMLACIMHTRMMYMHVHMQGYMQNKGLL